MNNLGNLSESINITFIFGCLNIKVVNLVKVEPDSDWFVTDHSHHSIEFHIIDSGKGYI